MKLILEQHVGQKIGLNVNRPFHIDSVTLLAVHDIYFSVTVDGDDETIYHIPYANIVRIAENQSGVRVPGFFHQKVSHPMVVKIGHIVEHVPA